MEAPASTRPTGVVEKELAGWMVVGGGSRGGGGGRGSRRDGSVVEEVAAVACGKTAGVAAEPVAAARRGSPEW